MLAAEFTGRNSGFRFEENTDDLFVGKTLLHGDALMWLMKTLLISWCINQRGAGQISKSVCIGANLRILVVAGNDFVTFDNEQKAVGGTQELVPVESANPQFIHSALGQGARMREVGDEVNHRQAGDGYEWHQVRSNSAIAFRMLIW